MGRCGLGRYRGRRCGWVSAAVGANVGASHVLRRFGGHLGILAIMTSTPFTVLGGTAICRAGRRIVCEGS
jgi:hypothetical protein